MTSNWVAGAGELREARGGSIPLTRFSNPGGLLEARPQRRGRVILNLRTKQGIA
jgi:hypothetical protein